LLRSSTKLRSGLNDDRRELAGIRRAIEIAHHVRHPEPQALVRLRSRRLAIRFEKAHVDLETQSSRTGAAGWSFPEHADSDNKSGDSARRAFMAGDSTGTDMFRVDRLYFCDAVTNPDYAWSLLWSSSSC
jgi:hypothetical protein